MDVGFSSSAIIVHRWYPVTHRTFNRERSLRDFSIGSKFILISFLARLAAAHLFQIMSTSWRICRETPTVVRPHRPIDKVAWFKIRMILTPLWSRVREIAALK